MTAKRSWFVILASIFGLLAILFLIFFPTIQTIHQTPSGYTYLLGNGYLPDYYQYLSWVKSGMDGNILLTSKLSELPTTPVFMHPLFLFTGHLARFVHSTPYTAFFMLRIVSTAIFYFSVLAVARKILRTPKNMFLFLTVFLTAGSLYTKDGQSILYPIPWFTGFTVLGKFILPPHHLLALACVIGILLLLDIQSTKKGFLLTALLLITIGFLNPSILLVSYFILLPGILRSLLKIVQTKTFNFSPPIILVLLTVPLLAYNQYLFATTDPWKLMYELMKNFRPPVAFLDYIRSLGLVLPVSLIALATKKSWKDERILSLGSWAFIPIFLFPLLGTILPMNESRLFQMYQVIPLSILAGMVIALAIGYCSTRIPRILSPILYAACIAGMFVSSFVLIEASWKESKSQVSWNNYALFATDDMMRSYAYLNNQKNDDVVVAGETVSLVIAALTPHRVLLGRDDAVRNYYERRGRIFDFLNGKLSQQELKTFLTTYRVRYTVFGIDTYPWSAVPYASSGMVKNQTNIGSITIIEWKR